MTNLEFLSDVVSPAGALIPEAPADNKTYGRKNGTWAEVTGGSGPSTSVEGGTSGTLPFQIVGVKTSPIEAPAHVDIVVTDLEPYATGTQLWKFSWAPKKAGNIIQVEGQVYAFNTERLSVLSLGVIFNGVQTTRTATPITSAGTFYAATSSFRDDHKATSTSPVEILIKANSSAAGTKVSNQAVTRLTIQEIDPEFSTRLIGTPGTGMSLLLHDTLATGANMTANVGTWTQVDGVTQCVVGTASAAYKHSSPINYLDDFVFEIDIKVPDAPPNDACMGFAVVEANGSAAYKAGIACNYLNDQTQVGNLICDKKWQYRVGAAWPLNKWFKFRVARIGGLFIQYFVDGNLVHVGKFIPPEGEGVDPALAPPKDNYIAIMSHNVTAQYRNLKVWGVKRALGSEDPTPTPSPAQAILTPVNRMQKGFPSGTDMPVPSSAFVTHWNPLPFGDKMKVVEITYQPKRVGNTLDVKGVLYQHCGGTGYMYYGIFPNQDISNPITVGGYRANFSGHHDTSVPFQGSFTVTSLSPIKLSLCSEYRECGGSLNMWWVPQADLEVVEYDPTIVINGPGAGTASPVAGVVQEVFSKPPSGPLEGVLGTGGGVLDLTLYGSLAGSSVPYLTGPTSPAGYSAKHSSTYSGTDVKGWHIFEKPLTSNNGGWINDGTPLSASRTEWVQITLPAAMEVSSYSMTPWSTDNFPSRTPTKWKIQGSNDETTWVDLDDKSVASSSWVYNTPTPFSMSTTGRYLHYRILITANGGDSYTALKNLTLNLKTYTQIELNGKIYPLKTLPGSVQIQDCPKGQYPVKVSFVGDPKENPWTLVSTEYNTAAGLPSIAGQEGKVLGVKNNTVQWVPGGSGGSDLKNTLLRIADVDPGAFPTKSLVSATFKPTTCTANGQDIRVYLTDAQGKPTGNPIPSIILGIVPGTPMTVTVAWLSNTSGPTKYCITYGDPLAPAQAIPQAAWQEILPYYSTSASGLAVQTFPSLAYIPPISDWGVAGTLIPGTVDVDQGVWDIDPPMKSTWGKEEVTKFRVGSNSSHGLSTPTQTSTLAGGSYTLTGPNGMASSPADMMIRWARLVSLPDGWAIHQDCVPWGLRGDPTAGIKTTIRYQVGGIWTYTWFDAPKISAPWLHQVMIYDKPTQTSGVKAPDIQDPSSALVFQIKSILDATVGPETPI